MAQDATNDDTAIIALTTGTITLQTGQAVTVQIEVLDVRELWLANIEVQYDPAQLYIIGTRSGTPVRRGTLLDPAQALVLRNRVADDTLQYTQSLVNPAEPVSGAGVIGTFEIFPLQAGDSQLTFNAVSLTRVLFETDESGQRLGTQTETINFAVAPLTLSISGPDATPPPEETATPTPSPTIDPNFVTGGEQTIEPEPPTPTPLPVVTLRPRTPTPTATPVVPPVTEVEAADNQPVLLVAVSLIVIALVGLIGLFVVSRRR